MRRYLSNQIFKFHKIERRVGFIVSRIWWSNQLGNCAIFIMKKSTTHSTAFDRVVLPSVNTITDIVFLQISPIRPLQHQVQVSTHSYTFV